MTTADALRAQLRSIDQELSALAVEWRRPTATADERNAVWLEHRALRTQRRAVENALAALGREQKLPPRDRSYARVHALSAAPFDYDGMIRLRLALSPRLVGIVSRAPVLSAST
jgi:hypothetical protein